MPTEVKATEYVVVVAEEDYENDISCDKVWNERMREILTDAARIEEGKVWFETWIVRTEDSVHSHPAAMAHELMGRQWRDL
jgi:hypothetical protein